MTTCRGIQCCINEKRYTLSIRLTNILNTNYLKLPRHIIIIIQTKLTSITLCEFSAPDEAQVPCSSVRWRCVAYGQSRIEMVGMEWVVAIDCKIAICIVRATHPDLREIFNIITSVSSGYCGCEHMYNTVCHNGSVVKKLLKMQPIKC